ncbi:hypothetical protein Q2K19_13520 [Micromonospora soli]|uniref:hypothetical protein n=1 Tax=Micromonospora sp. NBRC 110009 TaxID=3061627 RepID=UPI0026711F83|nr:hypothetical protein [Micromonospora sp. NBRC 110009]WKU01410.1 hypothetical protein Q2K19_13520 [Micromonospora sp. NBRC 110009]
MTAGVLLALALTGCSLFGRAEGATTPGSPGPTVSAEAGRRVSLVQRVGADGAPRTLDVDPSGRWQCRDCAGDGVDSTGQLTAEQTQRLQRMLADPALATETDEARQYKQGCIDALTSTLLIPPGLTITSQDCPGEERPAVGYQVLLLLTQATPAEDKS